jgi:hypothetical protein
MSHMFRPSLGVHDNVVDVDKRCDPAQRAEKLIHETLVDGGGVFQTEWEALELIQSAMRNESRLPSILLVQFQLVVALQTVQRREEAFATHC